MSRPSTHHLRPKLRRRWLRRALWAVLGILCAACTFDPDDRCGPNEVAWTGGERCVCAEGFAYTDQGCISCGPNAVATANGCACEQGYGRLTPEAPCEALPEGFGASCASDAECPAFYPHCQPSVGGGGYCTTQGCADATQCLGGYFCNIQNVPSFCQRPPLGAGRSCASNDDCAGTDALFCDLVFSQTCLVDNCLGSVEGCVGGLACCDLTSVGLPGASLCLAPENCAQ